MNVTIEEFRGLIELAGYYSTPAQDRYNHNLVDHLLETADDEIEFRAFIKNHYPEALQEWNAIQKVKGE